MKTNKVIKISKKMISKKIGNEKTNQVFSLVYPRFKALCLENANDCKEIKQHTEKKIFPYIAMFESLIKNDYSRNDAYILLDEICSAQAQPKAKAMRLMSKCFGLYKIMPKMFVKVTNSTFNEKAGFKSNFIIKTKKRTKFDMTKCIYCDVCKKYGCEEIIKCFCHTDDVTNGNIHPKLCWNRTKTMGDGDDLCDFDIYIH